MYEGYLFYRCVLSYANFKRDLCSCWMYSCCFIVNDVTPHLLSKCMSDCERLSLHCITCKFVTHGIKPDVSGRWQSNGGCVHYSSVMSFHSRYLTRWGRRVMKISAPSVTFSIRRIRSPAFVRRLWVVEEFLKRRSDDSWCRLSSFMGLLPH